MTVLVDPVAFSFPWAFPIKLLQNWNTYAFPRTNLDHDEWFWYWIFDVTNDLFNPSFRHSFWHRSTVFNDQFSLQRLSHDEPDHHRFALIHFDGRTALEIKSTGLFFDLTFNFCISLTIGNELLPPWWASGPQGNVFW